MEARFFRQTRGFTLLELLVVIGIIAVLIATLVPASLRARVQAQRAVDLSTIRQLALACVNYAAMQHGDLPLGSRLGNDVTTPSDNDDLQWVNTWTFAYFLSCTTNGRTAADWLAAPTVAGKRMDESLRRGLACVSMVQSPENGMYACVGIPSLRYDPSNLGQFESFMGYAYWGRRPPRVTGQVFDSHGAVAASASTFAFPRKLGQRASTDVLLSCDAYVNPIGYIELPHCDASDRYLVANRPLPNPGDGHSGPTAAMRGLCCAYTDGSARWVPRPELWAVTSGANNWYFFDGTRR